MNIWDFDDGVDTETVVDWCVQDREQLAADFFLIRPQFDRRPAAFWLEEFLDLQRIRVLDLPLASGQLGLCDLSSQTIYINSNMHKFVHHKTDLVALRASTLAHEYGHLRLHALEDQENVFVRSYRDSPHFHHPRSYQREREADLYGALFLVPLEALEKHKVVKNFLEHRAEKRHLSTVTIWKGIYRLARDFQVSPTLMKRCLFELGWLERSNKKHGDREMLRLRWNGRSIAPRYSPWLGERNR